LADFFRASDIADERNFFMQGHKYKYTPERVAEIKKAWDSGLTSDDIAKHFGIKDGSAIRKLAIDYGWEARGTHGAIFKTDLSCLDDVRDAWLAAGSRALEIIMDEDTVISVKDAVGILSEVTKFLKTCRNNSLHDAKIENAAEKAKENVLRVLKTA